MPVSRSPWQYQRDLRAFDAAIMRQLCERPMSLAELTAKLCQDPYRSWALMHDRRGRLRYPREQVGRRLQCLRVAGRVYHANDTWNANERELVKGLKPPPEPDWPKAFTCKRCRGEMEVELGEIQMEPARDQRDSARFFFDCMYCHEQNTVTIEEGELWRWKKARSDRAPVPHYTQR